MKGREWTMAVRDAKIRHDKRSITYSHVRTISISWPTITRAATGGDDRLAKLVQRSMISRLLSEMPKLYFDRVSADSWKASGMLRLHGFQSGDSLNWSVCIQGLDAG